MATEFHFNGIVLETITEQNFIKKSGIVTVRYNRYKVERIEYRISTDENIFANVKFVFLRTLYFWEL